MNLVDMFLYVSTTKWEGGDSVCFGFSLNFLFCYSLWTSEFPPLAQSNLCQEFHTGSALKAFCALRRIIIVQRGLLQLLG
ncbi:unnamed protein product [Arctogadus glacialis]